MRKRCLSRWLESEVIRSLKSAIPCIATTSVLPTSSGSHVASCSTSCPFSYSSSALSGSSASRPTPIRGSRTPIFSVKWRRLDTTISFSSSPLFLVCVSIRWTVWSRICRCRPGPGSCCDGIRPRLGIAITADDSAAGSAEAPSTGPIAAFSPMTSKACSSVCEYAGRSFMAGPVEVRNAASASAFIRMARERLNPLDTTPSVVDAPGGLMVAFVLSEGGRAD
mmetsp:Transcript_28882/g.67734  ORF Transcript_28882/g.67734 Transcript_28882/m.67734 type:complete len:223 (+) Transcript_28882:981-1649(+)